MFDMHGDTTTSHKARETHLARAGWLLPAVLLHLLAWLIVFGYLNFYVPRLRVTFEDYGVHLPQAAKAVIGVSSLVVEYGLPMAFLALLLVIGVDGLIVFLTRSRVVRSTLLFLFLIPPIGWLASCHFAMSQALAPIVEKLREG
jgi:type II secretory pathway component PulF